MLRALLDANLLISFLLAAGGTSPPVRLIVAAFNRGFILLLPDEVIEEVVRRSASKPYLARRIDKTEAEQFLAELGAAAERLPRLLERVAKMSRDPKDDYLIAHAIAAQADYLVSGDKDLLVLGQVDGVRIVSPADFLAVLEDPAGHR